MNDRSTRDEELDDLMRRASAIYNNMSLDERRKHDRAQRISWVYGEMRLSGHDVSHDQVEAMLVKTGALSASPIRVTVDGEPVTRDVTLDQVREYLRSKGWVERGDNAASVVSLWLRADSDGSPGEPCLWMDHGAIWRLIVSAALFEGRHPAAVLREIAGVGADASAGIEPMTDEEIDGLDRDEEQWRRAAAGFDATIVRRLLATIRARVVENARRTTMATENYFGKKLRLARRCANKTLEDVAEFLGVSIPYVSDIERGNRAPLATEKIERLAAFLSASAAELLRAAAESRGAFELDPKRSEEHRETGAALMHPGGSHAISAASGTRNTVTSARELTRAAVSHRLLPRVDDEVRAMCTDAEARREQHLDGHAARIDAEAKALRADADELRWLAKWWSG